MASDNEASCESDPNFAVICAFMEKFGVTCGLAAIDFLGLQAMLENTTEVSQELVDLHIKLLRKSRKSVTTERWERAIVKFCHTFCMQDAWEIERFGYKQARLSSKLRVLKELLEMQFDNNVRFKQEINKMSSEELRSQPLGKDNKGHAYWYQSDNNCQIRVYKEDPDEETWILVASDREGLVSLINDLKNGDVKRPPEPPPNEEDSNSLTEKPIIDTGQVDSSSESTIKKTSEESSENSNESTTKEPDTSEDEKKRARENDEELENEAKKSRTDEKIAEKNVEEINNSNAEIETESNDKIVKISSCTKETNEKDDNGPVSTTVENSADITNATTTKLEKEKAVVDAEKPIVKDEDTITQKQEDVSEAIEEPLMLVKGEGSGKENECLNPIIGEAIEEDLMFFYGYGDGYDCEAGNDDKEEAASSTNCVSIKKSETNSSESLLSTVKDSKTDNNAADDKNCTKSSKWDVETIIAKEDVDLPKKFFFGPPSSQISTATVGFGQNVPKVENEKGDIGYRIEKEDKVEGECVHIDNKTVGKEETKAESTNNSEIVNPVEDSSLAQSLSKNSSQEESLPQKERNITHKLENDNSDVPTQTNMNEKILNAKDTELLNNDTTANNVSLRKFRRPSKNQDFTSNDLDTNKTTLTGDTESSKNNDIISAIEQQIVKDESLSSIETNVKLPEVTAALVECDTDSADLKTSLSTEAAQPTVLVEKECIKKTAYLLGENEQSTVNNHHNENITSAKKVKIGRPRKNNNNNAAMAAPTNNEDTARTTRRSSRFTKTNEEAIEPTTKLQENPKISSSEDKEAKPIVKLTKIHHEKLNLVGKNVKVPEANKKQVQVSKPEEKKKFGKSKTVGVKLRTSERTTRNSKAVTNKIVDNEDKSNSPDSNDEPGQTKVEMKKSKQQAKEKNKELTKEETSNISEATTEFKGETKHKVDKTGDLSKLTKNEETLKTKDIKRGRPRKKPRKSRGLIKGHTEEGMMASPQSVSSSQSLSKEEDEASDYGKKRKHPSRRQSEDTGSSKAVSAVNSPKNVDASIVVDSSSGRDDDDDDDVLEVPETDPLDCGAKSVTLSTFSLDFTEDVPAPAISRIISLRKRGREEAPQNGEDKGISAKKMKLKGRRTIDSKLRKSIEEKKKQDLASSDEDNNKQRGRATSAIVISSDEDKKPRKPRGRRKRDGNEKLLHLGIDVSQIIVPDDDGNAGVRQSRRIAQQKIKEEAIRKEIEEGIPNQVVEKKKKKSRKSEKLKVKVPKTKTEENEDTTEEDDSRDSKKKKKRKKKHKPFDEMHPWRSSSGSSASEEEEFEEEEEVEEEEDETLHFASDHEFSPESDVEGDDSAQPLKRARTAKKESDIEKIDDCPCQKCKKSDHPEWILLCDKCDNGWHCSCLRPPLLVIPEGDWFCPPCQHTRLLTNLEEKLAEYDRKITKKQLEDRRKERLAYVGISLNNVLPAVGERKKKHKRILDDLEDEDGNDYGKEDRDADAQVDENDESDSEEESGTPTSSSSEQSEDEPIYQLRQRRQAHSYRFTAYDELISSAIGEDIDAGKGAGNQGRGKDIATIVNANIEEEKELAAAAAAAAQNEQEQNEHIDDTGEEKLPPVVPLHDKDKEAKPLIFEKDGDQNLGIIKIKKRLLGRRKHRKLNALDINSEDDDDEGSDEDFKGSSEDSDDEFDEDYGSGDSEVLESARRRKKGNDPVRRSTRARTSRYDADFIDDADSNDSDVAPRRRKKRAAWYESTSESESDRSWGRRRKPVNRSQKKSQPSSTSPSKRKKSKKKKKNEDSDTEVYRKKKPKIKYGLDEDKDDEGPVRRTRGKKINYIDALGSDSDDERVKRPPPRIESDEEYVAEEEEKRGTEDQATVQKNTDDPKIQIQSYTNATFTEILPDTIKDGLLSEDLDEENPITQMNRTLEMMDENEMEKLMEEEEYANKQLQLMAMQLEKEKRRKEREAKKIEEAQLVKKYVVESNNISPNDEDQISQETQQSTVPTPPPPPLPLLVVQKEQFPFSRHLQEPIAASAENLSQNSETNDELSEPPGVTLPLFSELVTTRSDVVESSTKKRKSRPRKTLEEAVANLGSVRTQGSSDSFLTSHSPKSTPPPTESNIEIAAPPQPFSASQPTPSVITRMLQTKPSQPGYPVGSIRAKPFAAMPDERSPTGTPPPPYRPQMFRQMNQFRPQHLFSGGGQINVESPASSPSDKATPPPPPYQRPPPARFSRGAPSAPPPYQSNYYGQFQEEAMPPTIYQTPYENFEGQPAAAGDREASKGFEEEGSGEFGGLVSYFSSQREDDLES